MPDPIIHAQPPAVPDDARLGELLDALLPAVRRAGEAVMEVYGTAFEVRGKSDHSPVTEADERAEVLLSASIEALGLGWPVIAEEAFSRGERQSHARAFWLVDPLDGTKEFVARNGEFTVNVGLVRDGEPVLGLVLAPALDRLYLGARGWGACLVHAGATRRIACRPPPPAGLTVLDSRSHRDGEAMQSLLARFDVREIRHVGSSLKLGLLAEGAADLYARLGTTMEWDLAAGDAVLRAAGGGIRTLDGAWLQYGKPGFANPGFIARGRT